MTSSANPSVQATVSEAWIEEIKGFVIDALNLELSADEIQADDPLYGDGMGLDSIDILELALALSKKYGVQLKSDHPDNQQIFSSLRNLATHIAAHRKT